MVVQCCNRRKECREDILDYLKSTMNYSRVIDLRSFEKNGQFLEGTGALVLDRVNGIAYVAVSERADVQIATQWAANMGYNEVVHFKATDVNGHPIYHTNVVMAVGTDIAVVCAEAVEDEKQRKNLLVSC